MSAPQAPAPRGVSMPTIVAGVLFGLAAATALLRQLLSVEVDVGASAPVVLLVAGGLLVVWAVVGIATRGRRQEPPAPD